MKAIPPLLILAAAVGCAGGGELTESQEYYAGRAVAASQIAADSLHDDGALEEYVSLVGWTLAFESDRPETFKGYHFGVLKTGAVNAFAAPGGFVFVTTGLLQTVQNEDELAGVLAHEIAHVNLRHPEAAANQAARKSGAMDVLGVAADVAGFFMSAAGKGSDQIQQMKTLVKGLSMVVDTVGEACLKGYGRDSELEADRVAVDLLSRPGTKYAPGALKAFIARLPQKDRGGVWSTHPDLEGRVENIDEEMRQRGLSAGEPHPARTARYQAIMAGLRGS